MPKQKTRQYLLAKRRALTPLQVEELSHSIQHAFISSEEFARAKSLALYAPIHNEVATAALMAHALAEGKKVLYPVVLSAAMVFRQVCAPGDLQEGAFGIREPKACCAVYAPAEIDIFIIPGVAFDLGGRRIGDVGIRFPSHGCVLPDGGRLRDRCIPWPFRDRRFCHE